MGSGTALGELAVLTDRDLARLMQRAESWPGSERKRARRLGVAPDLPAPIPGQKRPRYTRESVRRWLDTGSRRRAS